LKLLSHFYVDDIEINLEKPSHEQFIHCKNFWQAYFMQHQIAKISPKNDQKIGWMNVFNPYLKIMRDPIEYF
jgi:hypothetical protein